MQPDFQFWWQWVITWRNKQKVTCSSLRSVWGCIVVSGPEQLVFVQEKIPEFVSYGWVGCQQLENQKKFDEAATQYKPTIEWLQKHNIWVLDQTIPGL